MYINNNYININNLNNKMGPTVQMRGESARFLREGGRRRQRVWREPERDLHREESSR